MTIGHENGSVHIVDHRARPGRFTLYGGLGQTADSIVLRNDNWLKLVVALYFDPDGGDKYMRTEMSSFQYQSDEEGRDWVFRYDYEREPKQERHPGSHLHVHGELTCSDVKCASMLKDIHFTCGRPTIEATIRLLADQFEVPCAAPDDVWRPALAECEAAFLSVAHRQPSGSRDQASSGP